MGRAPCCDKANVKKGPWSPEEDLKLKQFIEKHGTGGNWIALPHKAGLKRCGKSCRLRWLNYLRPNIKHGEFSDDEDRIICTLYASIGSSMSSTIGLVMLLFLGLLSTTTCFQTSFMLERVPTSMEQTHLVARDEARLMSKILGLPIAGPLGSGFYFTKVKIGNPPKDFHLTVDTGSDLTWVNCIPCDGCPNISAVVPLHFYDPRSSHSAEPLSCSGHLCRSLPNARQPDCAASSQCHYMMSYGDGSVALGSYYLDAFHFDTFAGSANGSTPANVVFGCTTHQSGSLTPPSSAFDGLLGLGPHTMSIVSQLESQGVMPHVFSHCLNGEDKGGGGLLLLGEIVEPGIVYTPLVPKQTHYNVELLSISINGQTLPIDPTVFSTSRGRLGTVFDSGTTYSYLTEEAYDIFFSALSAAVSPSVIPRTMEGLQCFLVSSSIRDVFPLISLNFAGGASMVLKPETYLISNTDGVWCIGFRKSQFKHIEKLTILGDLVLKDKIIIYDLARQRLGWSDYDCSSSINVSLVPPRVSHSSRLVLCHHQLVPIAVGSFFVYISMFAVF